MLVMLKSQLNVDTGRGLGSMALEIKIRSNIIRVISDLSALVSVTIVDIFCILGSVSLFADWIVPAVLFKIIPSGKDDSFINVPVYDRKYP